MDNDFIEILRTLENQNTKKKMNKKKLDSSIFLDFDLIKSSSTSNLEKLPKNLLIKIIGYIQIAEYSNLMVLNRFFLKLMINSEYSNLLYKEEGLQIFDPKEADLFVKETKKNAFNYEWDSRSSDWYLVLKYNSSCKFDKSKMSKNYKLNDKENEISGDNGGK